MHLCPHCGTTLSNFEVNQGYKDITDISVYIKFKLLPDQKFGEKKEFVTGQNAYILTWTTTPWTLPGNVALAINKDVEYCAVRIDGVKELLILATDLVEKVLKNKKVEIVHKLKGSGLLGLEYEPLFNYYNNDSLENKRNGFKVYGGDFVTTTDGTGIVHIAPAFGEDDLNLGKTESLPFIQHVAMDGTFKKEVIDFAGQKVKPKENPQLADIEIIKYLAKAGTLFEKEKFIHSYPHCWRCETPLLNYATTSWFIKVTDLKDRLVKMNSLVSWNPPEIGEGRFGKWLEGARDWAISRSRYWGAPLPVWEKENGDRVVIGSIDQLKEKIGRKNNYFLMRHGQSERNLENLVSCKKENIDPLTEKGRKEVLSAFKEINKEKINLIISSPFLRTKETAEIVAKEIGIKKEEIIFDDRLGEISCGKYDGSVWSELHFGRQENAGVETIEDIKKRVIEFMFEIDKKYEGKNILIVSHGGPIRILKLWTEYLTQKDIEKHYYDFPFVNAEKIKIDFVALPHNEKFEIDLHRPYIDEVILCDEKGKPMKRIPEVFDCWLESGSMSFAQNHYPFENKELFEKKNSPIFPADFIAEGQDQTRGWFYTMIVLGTGVFDMSPYKRVVVNGMILAEDGRKMSKSLNNYPDIMYIVDKYGADALRYYLISSPAVKAEDLNFSEKGVDEISKKIVQKVYNVLSFYEMYRPSAERPAADIAGALSTSVLDRWIMSRLIELHQTVTKSLDNYELDRASRPIMDFVDDLSTWYLRRSRDRFKSDDEKEREAVCRTMAFVLVELAKIMAPFMPFLSEEVYLQVTMGLQKESVHLENWPDMSRMTLDTKLVGEMNKARSVVTSALELRQKAGLKVRQPLSSLTITEEFTREVLEIIKDEMNVKEIKVGSEISLDTNLTPELKSEGLAREIIRAIQDIRKKENLNPSDRIEIIISTDDKIKNVFETYEEMIKSVTLVSDIKYSAEMQIHSASLEGSPFSVSLAR
jgi:isoleucyl-tRNA synthetase